METGRNSEAVTSIFYHFVPITVNLVLPKVLSVFMTFHAHAFSIIIFTTNTISQ
jgi:hypothetical protein